MKTIAAMELCVKALRAWMNSSTMKTNNGKTVLLIIGTKQQLKKVLMNIFCP